jgi:hypothetical protein
VWRGAQALHRAAPNPEDGANAIESKLNELTSAGSTHSVSATISTAPAQPPRSAQRQPVPLLRHGVPFCLRPVSTSNGSKRSFWRGYRSRAPARGAWNNDCRHGIVIARDLARQAQ